MLTFYQTPNFRLTNHCVERIERRVGIDTVAGETLFQTARRAGVQMLRRATITDERPRGIRHNRHTNSYWAVVDGFVFALERDGADMVAITCMLPWGDDEDV